MTTVVMAKHKTDTLEIKLKERDGVYLLEVQALVMSSRDRGPTRESQSFTDAPEAWKAYNELVGSMSSAPMTPVASPDDTPEQTRFRYQFLLRHASQEGLDLVRRQALADPLFTAHAEEIFNLCTGKQMSDFTMRNIAMEVIDTRKVEQRSHYASNPTFGAFG